MMRRAYLFLLLLAAGATASAQQIVVHSAVPALDVPPPEVHASPDELVARLMSFDKNSDGRITKDEVFERMENVIARGDVNGDAALDVSEIRAVAEKPPAPIAVRGFQAGHYGFSEDAGLSSKLRIEGALEDLRLASPAREEAHAIVTAFVDGVEKKATADLLEEMDSFLSPEQMTRLQAALTRPLPASMIVNTSTGATMRVIMGGGDLRPLVQSFHLPEPQNSRAMAAVEFFKGRVRPGDVERDALLGQLKDVLTDEERDDFRAALDRRPIVKSGAFVAFDTVQSIKQRIGAP